MTTPATSREPSGQQLLQKLANERAIRIVLQNYARGVDRMDMPTVRGCFAGDAVCDYGGFFTGPADEFVSWLEESLRTCTHTMHFLGQSSIAVDEDSATSELYCIAYHRMPSDRGDADDLVLGVRYVDELRADPAWEIVRRIVIFDWSRLDRVPDRWELPSGSAVGGRGLADARRL